jgi:hypothetical protein
MKTGGAHTSPETAFQSIPTVHTFQREVRTRMESICVKYLPFYLDCLYPVMFGEKPSFLSR